MVVVKVMKKGFSLIEVMTSLILLSTLLSCVGVVLTSGLKYQKKVNTLYDEESHLNQAMDLFDQLASTYQNEVITKNNNYLLVGNQIIFAYVDYTLTFYFPDDVINRVEGVLMNDFTVLDKLLEVEFIREQEIIKRYYYIGGPR